MRVAVVVLLAGCYRAVADTPVDGAAPMMKDAAKPDAGASPNVAFVSSLVTAFPDVTTADTTCGTLAMNAQLPGTFVAWVSSTGMDAVARLGSARGWVGTDGLPFVDKVSDLLAGKIFYPLRHDELGNDVGPAAEVATGTRADGSDDAGFDCDGGAALVSVGYAGAAGADWTRSQTLNCTTAMHLYCLEVDRDVPVSVPDAAEYPRAFVSTGKFVSSSAGRGSADMMCAAEAAANGVTGTFDAVLAVDGSTAIGRLGSATLPWVRLDAVHVTTDFSAFTAPLAVDARGAYLTGEPAPTVYTGAQSGSSDGNFDCASWMDTGSGENARTGQPTLEGTTAFNNGQTQCATPLPVYCAEVTP